MELNKETINHYRGEIIPLKELKSRILLNTNYLKEKPTWYEFNGKLRYFKIRNDLRIFTELFFGKFASEIMDLETLKYEIACVRTIDPDVKPINEESKYGLLSDSFQDLTYNHYLANEIMDPQNSDFVFYNSNYSLVSLLNYFENILASDDFEKIKLFLIKLFIADAFTYQLDRNPNNIAFQIPKITGLSYKERLRIELIKKVTNFEKYLSLEDGVYKLKGFTPNLVYDSERCMGVDHKNGLKYNKEYCWNPNFPYSDELFFENGEIAAEVSKKKYDGYDPNLLCLYLQYQDICEPYLERLAYDDEYRKILETFKNKPDQVVLAANEYEYFQEILKDRQEVIKRILTL